MMFAFFGGEIASEVEGKKVVIEDAEVLNCRRYCILCLIDFEGNARERD